MYQINTLYTPHLHNIKCQLYLNKVGEILLFTFTEAENWIDVTDQSWVFIGRTDVEAETPILWPPDAKSWLIWKDPDAGKDWGQEEKGTTEDEMVGWHHWLDGHVFGWTLGVGDGQGSLAYCGSWDCKESDTTERLNWTELNHSPREGGDTKLIFYGYRFQLIM